MKITITCPKCGDVLIPIDVLDGLHSGLIVECPECGCDIVIDVMTPEERGTLWKNASLWRATRKEQ
jgi:uncharacterized Zn finger protein